jgi:hypothetical protein
VKFNGTAPDCLLPWQQKNEALCTAFTRSSSLYHLHFIWTRHFAAKDNLFSQDNQEDPTKYSEVLHVICTFLKHDKPLFRRRIVGHSYASAQVHNIIMQVTEAGSNIPHYT